LDPKEFIPWDEKEVQNFLKTQCSLNKGVPILGAFVKHHCEVLFKWWELIKKGELKVPFEIVHVDAHADLGLDFSVDMNEVTKYILGDLLQFAPNERCTDAIEKHEHLIASGNYLIFAIAFQWVSKVIYVHHPREKGNDFCRYYFENHDSDGGFVELRRYSAKQLNDLSTPENLAEYESLKIEPKVPIKCIAGDKYREESGFAFMFLTHSPDYTPETSAALIPIIREYVREVAV
jgi:hypothetical protein